MSLLRIAKLAQRDLVCIKAFVSLDDPTAALNLIERHFSTLNTLARNPGVGERRDDLRPRLRQFTSTGYVIFFYPMANGVCVARILRGSRDLTSVFMHRKQ
jgi:toxin ParE1/3/4